MSSSDFNPDRKDDADVQLNADGSLRHLLTLKGLSKDILVELLDSAESFLSPEGSLPVRSNDVTVALLKRRWRNLEHIANIVLKRGAPLAAVAR